MLIDATVPALAKRVLDKLEDPRYLRRCARCGVWSIFARMRFERITNQPMDYASLCETPKDKIIVHAIFYCMDLYDCVRRERDRVGR